MKLSTNNFTTAIKQIIVGGDSAIAGAVAADAGFLKDVSLSPQSIATTGSRATAENSVPADVIVLDAAGEDAIVNFTVPRDYDEKADHLKVVLLISHVSGTSIPVGASAASLGRPGSAVAAKSGFSAPATTSIASGSDCVEVEADLSTLTNLRHDNLSVNFAAGTPVGAGVAHVIGARVEYRSTLVSYDQFDASGNPLR